MHLPTWTWQWAWNGFLRWSKNPTLSAEPTARQRWQVVAWAIMPGIRHHYLRPAEAWLHRKLPTPVLLLRLKREGGDWYSVPTMSAAIHLSRRLGEHVLEGDFVRIERGAVTMGGFENEDLHICEFWPVARASNAAGSR